MLLDDSYPHLFDGETVIVAASGPSLTASASAYSEVSLLPVIAVNDAIRLVPFADVLYAADGAWWRHHRGVPEFGGQRWSVLDDAEMYRPQKMQLAEQYDINLLLPTRELEFSRDRRYLTLGNNSGFQAINLAMHMGAARIVLVGFDMQGTHFFGPHPLPLRNSDPSAFIHHFEWAAKNAPVEIVNATPGSALKCFPMVNLEDEL